ARRGTGGPSPAEQTVPEPTATRPRGNPKTDATRTSVHEFARLYAGGNWIRTCMGHFPVKWLFSVLCQFFVRSGKGPFFIPSPTIRFPERAEWVKGPKR